MFTHHKRERVLLHPHHDSGIPNDPTPADQAIYVPSVTPGYSQHVAQAITAGGWHRELSDGVTPEEMSFLGTDTKKAFALSHVLFSAGQALTKIGPCMVRDRKRGYSRIIGDSGGYQIGQGTAGIDGYQDRARILDWLEATTDVAMTLDIPPGPVGRSLGYRYTTVEQCLAETLDHLKFFADNRRSNELILLNVIQGNFSDHGFHWYDSVKAFEFEGYAIAGLLRNDMYHVCRLLIRMLDDGKLQKARWLHFLGTARLDTAVMLTAIQRVLAAKGLPVRISFDTASPFLMMSRNRAYTFANYGKQRMTYTTVEAPYGPEYHDSKAAWPWPSEIGNRLVMGDLCVDEGTSHRNATQRDRLGNHLLALHNLQSICFAIHTANRVLDAEIIARRHSVAEAEADAVMAIQEIFKEGTEAAVFRRRGIFEKLRGTSDGNIEEFSEDELRDP